MVKITRQQLLDLYENETKERAAEKLGVSVTTFYKKLKKAGIKLNYGSEIEIIDNQTE